MSTKDLSKEWRGMKRYSQQGQGEDAGMMENDTGLGRPSEKLGNVDYGPIAKIQSC